MLKIKKLFSMLLIAFFVFSLLTAAYGDDSVKETPINWHDSPADGPETEFGTINDLTQDKQTSVTTPSPGEIRVFIDGRQVNFPDTKPYIKNGRTLVPVRFVSQEMGAKVNWNNKKREVLIEKGGKKISLKIGSKEVYVNGTKKVIDVPAELKNGRTMVPLRFISEAFGANVRWIDAERKVVINTK